MKDKNSKGGGFMIEKDDKIKALYKDDLQNFLEATGIYTDFIAGNVKCCYCGDVITEGNLHAFIPCEDHFEVCCSRTNCNILFVQSSGH